MPRMVGGVVGGPGRYETVDYGLNIIFATHEETHLLSHPVYPAEISSAHQRAGPEARRAVPAWPKRYLPHLFQEFQQILAVRADQSAPERAVPELSVARAPPVDVALSEGENDILQRKAGRPTHRSRRMLYPALRRPSSGKIHYRRY